MEEQKLRAIFDAIVSDNLKKFEAEIAGDADLKIRFGRFPLLSAMYLFESYKILSKYEVKLARVKDFEEVFEYFDLYKKLRSRAKKSLRLLCECEVIYPIEMLAIIDDRKTLVSNYKLLYKNDKIIENLKKIYILDSNLHFEATASGISIERKKFDCRQRFLCAISLVIVAVLMLLNFAILIGIVVKNGVGTAISPIKISSESELVLALKNDKNYILTQDLVLSGNYTSDEFKGSLDGTGHTVTLVGDTCEPLAKVLSGTIKNLKLKMTCEVLTISSSTTAFAGANSGKIEGCEFFGDFELIFTENDDDIYFAPFAVTNNGNIISCKNNSSFVGTNNREYNAFISGIAGISSGKIKGCENRGDFSTDTVDLAGICIENSGTIDACTNSGEIYQNSSKQWNPNCSGICINSIGDVKNCENLANVTSISTVDKIEEQGDDVNAQIYVYGSGIVCENMGSIGFCKNSGNISSSSKIALVYSAGIACVNTKILSSDYRTMQSGIIKNCLSCASISCKSETSQVYAGGVVAFNNSMLSILGFEGEIHIESSQDENVFAGGVCGLNEAFVVDFVNKAYLGTISDCYSCVKFDMPNMSLDRDKTFVAAIATTIMQQGLKDDSQIITFLRSFISGNYLVEDSSFNDYIIGYDGSSKREVGRLAGCTVAGSVSEIPIKIFG